MLHPLGTVWNPHHKVDEETSGPRITSRSTRPVVVGVDVVAVAV